LAEQGLDAGLIDEHAPKNRDDSRERKAYAPTEDERKAIALAERLLSKAKKHRSRFDSAWPRYYQMFRGKQWDHKRPSFRHSEVINHIFKTIQSTVPIQMDTRPRFEFLPEEPADMELAEILNQAAESDWSKNNWSLQLLEVMYDANIYGTGISSLTYDPDGNYKTGKLCFDSNDPLYFYPDPDALDVNKKCGFAVYAEPMDVSKIKRKYPNKKDFIRPDLMDLSSAGKTDLYSERRQIPNDNFASHTEGATDPADKDRALLITVWIAPEFLTDDFEEKQGEDGQFTQTASWPNGRKIVICNKVLLEGDANEYDDGKIPHQRLLNYVMPREFWGMSEVEQLEGPQKTFNKILNFALDVMTLMGNPIWIVDTTSDIDTDNLVNKPGLVIEKAPGSEVTRQEGVQLQPYVLQLADKMVQWFDSVSGSQDVTRGIQPTGITAASAIDSLMEAAQTRLRQKARNCDYYLQDLGQQWLSRTFQFRTAPEMYRLTGKDGVDKYFRAHVEEFEKTKPVMTQDPVTGVTSTTEEPTGEMGKRMIVQPYAQDPVTGKTTGQMNIEDQKVYEIMGKFDCRVITGSSLPFAKAEKETRQFKLFEMGVIDAEELLKSLDYPNWEAVLQRMQQKAAMEAQAMAMQEASGVPAVA
jgi:hypothetical protein